MTDVTALFWDVGGVLLTNGWDRHARRAAVDEFGLDWEEFRDRHDFVADAFETGKLDLDGYLERTVFYRDRPFTIADFRACMERQSRPLGGTLDFARSLAASGRYFMATINNESRHLNEFRIDRFGLRDVFAAFFSSCFLGVKKPDDALFATALEVSQREPAACVFVDDRDINLECARRAGMTAIHYLGLDSLQAAFADLGVTS